MGEREQLVEAFVEELEQLIDREARARAAAAWFQALPAQRPRRLTGAPKISRARAPLKRKGSDRLSSTARAAPSARAFQGEPPVEREKASGDRQAAPRVRSGKDKRRTAQVAISTGASGARAPEVPSPAAEGGPPPAGKVSPAERSGGQAGPGGSTPRVAPSPAPAAPPPAPPSPPTPTQAPAAAGWKPGDVVVCRIGGHTEHVARIESAGARAGMWRVAFKNATRTHVAMEEEIVRRANDREARFWTVMTVRPYQRRQENEPASEGPDGP